MLSYLAKATGVTLADMGIALEVALKGRSRFPDANNYISYSGVDYGGSSTLMLPYNPFVLRGGLNAAFNNPSIRDVDALTDLYVIVGKTPEDPNNLQGLCDSQPVCQLPGNPPVNTVFGIYWWGLKRVKGTPLLIDKMKYAGYVSSPTFTSSASDTLLRCYTNTPYTNPDAYPDLSVLHPDKFTPASASPAGPLLRPAPVQ